MTVVVPIEVWLHIARFIPEDQLREMYPLNRLFFDLALDVRYREISIKSLDDNVSRIIARLGEPHISKRVRALRLEFNHSDRFPQTYVSSPSASTRFKGLKAALRLGPRSPSPSLRPPLTSIEDLTARLSAIFPCLVYLELFHVKSYNWPAHFDLPGFFNGAWTSFGRNLRTFVLGGKLDDFQIILNSGPVLPSVQEIELEFGDNPLRGAANNDANILVDCVAPFINRFALQLQCFRVWSLASVDLSAFFEELCAFPILDTLAIRAPLNRSFANPSGLTRLLLSSSPTLRRLQLRLNPAGVPNPEEEQRLSHWLTETFAKNVCLACDLHTLYIYPSSHDQGFDSLITCLKRSSKTLRNLIIHDRYLHFSEIERIIGALSSDLTFLRLNAWVLSATLLDLLAASLPNLSTLVLHVVNIMGVEGQHTSQFSPEMLSRDFSRWKLEELTIRLGGNDLDHEAKHVIKSSIPFLRFFCGEKW